MYKFADLVLTGNNLSYKDLDDIEDSTKNWSFKKCLNNLSDFFNSDERIDKTIEKSHQVVKKFLDEKIRPVLFQAYL